MPTTYYPFVSPLTALAFNRQDLPRLTNCAYETVVTGYQAQVRRVEDSTGDQILYRDEFTTEAAAEKWANAKVASFRKQGA